MQKNFQIKNYHELRLKRFDYRYRLKRRTYEVINAIKKVEDTIRRIRRDFLMCNQLIVCQKNLIGGEYL